MKFEVRSFPRKDREVAKNAGFKLSVAGAGRFPKGIDLAEELVSSGDEFGFAARIRFVSD
jgi:hypothetical protein